ncbi:hypothetical protein ACJX0J_029011, partial [Zea mays]
IYIITIFSFHSANELALGSGGMLHDSVRPFGVAFPRGLRKTISKQSMHNQQLIYLQVWQFREK